MPTQSPSPAPGAYLQLPAHVVIHSDSLTLEDLRAVAARGTFPGVARVSGRSCDLRVAGVPVARGKPVKQGGRWFLQVTEVAE